MVSFEKVAKWVIKGGLFIIFALPLIFISNFFFPFIVPKNLIFRLIVEISFLFYLVLAFRFPIYRPKINFLNVAVLTYFVVLAITSAVGLYFARSFWGNYERMDGLLNQFHFLIYFIILTSVLKSKEEWYQLISFSLGSALIMSLFALGQKLNFAFLIQTDNVRLAGTIGNAAFFASYLVFHFFFILFFLFKPKRFQIIPFVISFCSLEILFFIVTLAKGWTTFSSIFLDYNFLAFFLVFNALMVLLWLYQKKEQVLFVFLSLFLLLSFFDLFSSGTRGALLGVSVSIFLLLLVFMILGTKKEKIVAASVLGLILLSVLFIFLSRNSSWVQNNSNIQNVAHFFSGVTVESRLLTWQSSWQAVTASPFRFVFGYGLENFSVLFDKYFNQKIYQDAGSQVWFDRAHNLIFDLWTSSGLLGLVAFLTILATSLVYLFKAYTKDRQKNRDVFLIFGALLICYFIQDLFVFDTLNTYILIFFCLAFISFIYAQEFTQGRFNWPQKSINVGIFTWAGLIAILALVIWIFNARVAIANLSLVKGSLGDHFKLSKQESLAYLEKSLSYGYMGRFETTQQLMGFSRGLTTTKNVSADFAYKAAKETIQEFNKNIEMDPLNVRHYLYLASFYNDVYSSFAQTHSETNQWPQAAIDLCDQAATLSPTRPQIYFVKARALMYQNKVDQAFAVFRQGVDVAPWVVQSHVDLAILYIFGDRPDLGQKEIDYIISPSGLNATLTVEDYSRLANVYNVKKSFVKMAEMFIKLTELDSKNITYYAQAAGGYAKAGDNKSAKTWALKALEVNPNVKADIDQFLIDLEQGKYKE
ncbi:MAG: O-antigen ligase family protein [Candidatus Buchananbacteria bacterium]